MFAVLHGNFLHKIGGFFRFIGREIEFFQIPIVYKVKDPDLDAKDAASVPPRRALDRISTKKEEPMPWTL